MKNPATTEQALEMLEAYVDCIKVGRECGMVLSFCTFSGEMTIELDPQLFFTSFPDVKEPESCGTESYRLFRYSASMNGVKYITFTYINLYDPSDGNLVDAVEDFKRKVE